MDRNKHPLEAMHIPYFANLLDMLDTMPYRKRHRITKTHLASSIPQRKAFPGARKLR